MQPAGTPAITLPGSGDAVAGRIEVPPSKSVTQRALVAAALAGPPARVQRPLDAEDPRLLHAGLRTAGFDLRWEGETVTAHGRWSAAGGEVFCGNNGTGLRFLVAQLAALPGEWVVDGTPRLRERPLAPLVRALRALGARIEGASGGADDRLPLRIHGRELAGGEVDLDSELSSQFVSALLLLGARLPRGLTLRLPAPPPSRPYVELTAEVLTAFGVAVEARDDARLFRVAGGEPRPATVVVEGDWSAAAFPFAAAAVAGGRVAVIGVRADSRQGDAMVLRLLAAAGCSAEGVPGGVALAGPARRPLVADLSDAPDLFPALAVVVARGGGRLTGLAGLAVKESDRLAVMASHLARLGFEVERGRDWFAGSGRGRPAAPSEPLDPAGDHRIAMAMAVAGTAVPGVRLADPECVAKSWPQFWEAWGPLCGSPR